ncbi:Sirohydrochlorin cobaltochelatase [uncultured Clostridium sp.]|uniref:sirohydrochlorin cobaltochelatase n=1 Tax=uncultured Clostridium sp. TaxID=59620 RepID=UPI000821F4DC|nr:sirohydrochlorin cobaltochelatase [uncultured Clostridium sp.]SCI83892.1 Sirohydrochlorin cobaltochelatase [uncultured Clostridium sp.]
MKKAILVISFGTSYIESLERSIFKVEDNIRREYREFDVFRAFTSHFIIKKLKEKHSLDIWTPEEALKILKEAKYEEVIVQPLHLIAGEEFTYIKTVIEGYKDKFNSIKLGRPIFYYQGIEELPQDYSEFIKSINDILDKNKLTVMVGHGTAHPAGASYGCLQTVLKEEGYDNVFVGTIEGYPSFNSVLKLVKEKKVNELTLMPLLLVAGDHAQNDIGSDEEDSWKSMFEKEGIKTKVIMKGLGEYPKFNQLYINRIDDLICGRYEGAGETKKGHKKKHKVVVNS